MSFFHKAAKMYFSKHIKSKNLKKQVTFQASQTKLNTRAQIFNKLKKDQSTISFRQTAHKICKSI